MQQFNEHKYIRTHGLGIAMAMVISVTALSVSCIFDTETNLCERNGLRCRPEQVCAAEEAVCIPIGGCGDGIMALDEECDDGNTVNKDGCSENCTLQDCGNEVLEPGEDCDTGPGDSQGCDEDCSFVECGDNHLNMAAGEECDE